MTTYRTGFIGASLPAASEWMGKVSQGAKTILVPFAGSGRDIASMTSEDTITTSFDTQFYSKAVVDGVFASKEVETNVDKLRYTKGYMYNERPMKNMDELSAGFIDWVAANGTLFDKACIASAVVRCTLMGRMNQWYANPEMLFKRFNNALIENTQWVNQPGEFDHHEGSVFDNLPTGHFDLMQVDPPKVVVGSDVYSAYFNSLNTALGGVMQLPKWNWREVMPRFRELMALDVDRVIFMYVSGVRPDNDDVQKMLLEFGTKEDEISFTHKSRVDTITVIKKGDPDA